MRNISLLNQAASGTDPIVGPWIGLGELTRASLQLVTTETLDGEWRFEVSNVANADTLDDPDEALGVDVTDAWELVDTDGESIKTVDHSDAETQRQVVQASELGNAYARLIFTPSSGAGLVLGALTLRRPWREG